MALRWPMGLFGGKKKYENMTLAELHSTPPPGWCIWVADGQLHADTSGMIPYAMRAKSFFGPNLESWFSALQTCTFAAKEITELRTLYAGMPSERLRQLLAEAAELRPGAEPLLRQELEKRRIVDQSE
jgi:hypothetical protein